MLGELNLGEAISELKVLRVRYEIAESEQEKEDLIGRIIEVIGVMEIPQFVGQAIGE